LARLQPTEDLSAANMAGVVVAVLGSWEDPAHSARQLFAAVRALDAAGLDVILARELADPTHGLGRALADRLRRAAAHIIEA
jgi:hypothetical protein